MKWKNNYLVSNVMSKIAFFYNFKIFNSVRAEPYFLRFSVDSSGTFPFKKIKYVLKLFIYTKLGWARFSIWEEKKRGVGGDFGDNDRKLFDSISDLWKTIIIVHQFCNWQSENPMFKSFFNGFMMGYVIAYVPL